MPFISSCPNTYKDLYKQTEYIQNTLLIGLHYYNSVTIFANYLIYLYTTQANKKLDYMLLKRSTSTVCVIQSIREVGHI